eukprot:CAMPEP_0202345030 /NCGR_PEP_ID=MMETSP1126-20121109/4445_1 /ASSEMBLY_ACC=CAM_ASM_000457 /TAXON_ID=3047 /ORGANISM="Dunaliella tertiolecta, Strain CCMP1320" /LENGTH=591 /DNA_ID=CAMNT_0048936279 /DNA_START=174 /DNA_END=1949 /DNA_ORIENTATION=-
MTPMATPMEIPGPKCKIELPMPGDTNNQYGGTRTVREGYTFDVAHQIGEGTYGQVFVGNCKKDKAKVALKKIRMDTEKEGFPITAIREIKILSSMRHENVVNLREIVRSEIHRNNNYKGSIYMVFDYAEYDLTGLMETVKYKFSESQIKCIMKQLLKGLAYVHGNGVLHRDLKASNILIDSNGTVKLADFGLARTWQERQDSRLTNRVITLWYRPPELLLGAERYGPEVDMWSVGSIFAELLVGKPIFPGKEEIDQLDKIFQIMGTPTPETWPGVEKLPLWANIAKGRYGDVRLRKWVRDMTARTGQQPVKESAIQLMEKMLTLDPSKRCTALEAFQDPWFWNSDPDPCDPKDLPCKGSSHEFTMKKRRHEERETHHPMPLPHPQQLMHGGVPPPNAYYQRAGQAMHAGGMMGPPDGSKRARTGGMPPAAGAGYAGVGRGRGAPGPPGVPGGGRGGMPHPGGRGAAPPAGRVQPQPYLPAAGRGAAPPAAYAGTARAPFAAPPAYSGMPPPPGALMAPPPLAPGQPPPAAYGAPAAAPPGAYPPAGYGAPPGVAQPSMYAAAPPRAPYGAPGQPRPPSHPWNTQQQQPQRR